MEALYRANPSDRTFEFHLGNQYTNAGIVVSARGYDPATVAEALSLERRALALDQHLLSADPEHALRYQRALGADHGDIGQELYERGDYADAIQEYDAALDALAKTTTDPNNSQARIDTARIMHHLAQALFALGRTDAAAAAFAQSLATLNAVATHADTLEIQYLLATCEMGLGQIEAQRAATTTAPDRLRQARHWHAAHDWFAASVPRYERLLKQARVTLPPQDARGYPQATAGLARSDRELARLEGAPSAWPPARP
jgi:tetratricopeptide (TPR) repeat protein